MDSLIKESKRKWMLEMIDEIRTNDHGSWAIVLLMVKVRQLLDELGGLAGEW
ncbi:MULTISPECIES: hypothetical protein [unclassified Burkholderia]|uniref:hypothetical protein n=1 Tax=unclassified Burkholderia TaxID=2613784 RepID=UPI000A7D43B9|nr:MULTISPECIES: hypothetical protein [unclassified Burkholderia]